MKCYRTISRGLYFIITLALSLDVFSQGAGGGALIHPSISMAEVQNMTAKYKALVPEDEQFGACLDQKILSYLEDQMQNNYFVISGVETANKYSPVAKDISLVFRPYVYGGVLRGFAVDFATLPMLYEALESPQVEDQNSFRIHMYNKYGRLRFFYQPME